MPNSQVKKIDYQINWKVLGYILILSSVIGLAYNFVSPEGISLKREEVTLESIKENQQENIQKGEPDLTKIKPVILEQAYEMFNEEAVFVDARDMWEFGDGHIQGALNFPQIEYETDHPMLSKLDKDDKLVIYCGSSECGLSTRLAVDLLKLGYNYLYVFEEGWDRWIEAGYPTSEGNE